MNGRGDAGAGAVGQTDRPQAGEDWPRLKQLLEAALARDPSLRRAFVADACAGDVALQRALEELLAAHAEAGDFLESPTQVDRIASALLGQEEPPSLVAGRRLGPYEVVALIEAGGMGEVYRARDTRLGRDVALKVMRARFSGDAERLRLFESEARAAGAVSDPNVVAVFDVGCEDGMPYVVSELLEGETLDRRLREGRLGVRKSVEYAVQMAHGLAAAHAKGVIHRDLKPSNVFITRQGRVKLLDFGLAKLLSGASAGCKRTTDEAREGDVPASTPISTPASTLMGTPGYIAPERLEGEPGDHRADIFALGAILYRMLAGRAAFADAPTLELLQSSDEPRSFSPSERVPPALERIVRRCLDKRPEERFQTAQDVRFALESLSGVPLSRSRWPWAAVAVAALVGAALLFHGRASGPVGAPIRSLAVLPLHNASADPDQEYFADGMTDALIAEMARSPDLRVISRNSVMGFKAAPTPRLEIARRLGVDAVLTGSVTRAGRQVTIAVELFRPAGVERSWSGSYDGDVRDIAALQHEVATAVSSEIAVADGPEHDHASRHGPRSVEAYEAYLRGRHYWNMRSAEAAPRAVDQFNLALELDPLYAQAYAGLADTYVMLGDLLYLMPHEDAFARAEAAARRALELDPSQAEAHASLGHLRMHAWRWAEAERAFDRALALNPGYATAHQWKAYTLASEGRMEEAVAAIERAQRLDPLSLIINADMAQVLYFARRYDEALAQCAKTLQMNPGFAEARRVSFLVLQRLHRDKEALADLETYRRGPGGGPGGSVGYGYAMLGRTAEARAVLKALAELSRRRAVPPYDVGVVHAGLGENDRALGWLGKSLDASDPESMILPVDPRLDGLRGDPRFAGLLRRMGLPLK